LSFKKKIVLIGCTGLVGRKLLSCLSANNEVIGIHSKNHEVLQDTFSRYDIDFVIFASQSSDYRNPKLSASLFGHNVSFVRDTLERFAGKVKHVVFFSSGSVYSAAKNTIDETSSINYTSTNPYVNSKIMGEMVLNTFKTYFDTVTILRPFFIYGKHQNKEMLFHKMVENVKSGANIFLASGVGIYFNPIYVDDVCDVTKKLIEQELALGEIYNLMGPERITLGEVVQYIGNLLGIDPIVQITEDIPGNFVAKSIHNTKDLSIKTTVEDGLKKMLF
jgi:UDP-glucose 4-epimerase